MLTKLILFFFQQFLGYGVWRLSLYHSHKDTSDDSECK